MSGKLGVARRLSRSFFERPTIDLARALIGLLLVHETAEGRAIGRIVETEAYLAEGDAASHSRRGPTARNRAMFGAPGTAYVYRIYGLHHCLNVVSAPEGVGEAVLLRALEPLEGLALMAERRGRSEERSLCSGPAKLVRALGVRADQDGADLVHGPLRLELPPRAGRAPLAIVASARIGISKAKELPLRFHAAGSPFVSRA